MTKNQIYKHFADMIYKKSGIYYPEENYYQLDSRINALCKYVEVDSVEALYSKFSAYIPPEALNFLVDIATNNETSFFRDKTPFHALAEIARAELEKPNRTTPFRVWSAASSTGQESYSILIFTKLGVELFASDIKQECLEKTKNGVYSHLEIQRGLPAPFLIKYFQKTPDEKWQVKEKFRNFISTQKLNLFTDVFPAEKKDVIFCRNVLIYQTPENKKEIINRLQRCLNPGGYIILGSSENLMGISDAFERARIADCTCYQLPDPNAQQRTTA